MKRRRKNAISLIISFTSVELFNAINEHLWAINERESVLKPDSRTITDDQWSFHPGLIKLKESGLGAVDDCIAN